MNNINYEALSVFVEGMKTDWDQHAETSKSYQNSVNGRLHSHNGTLSFSSIKGTKKVYENQNIASFNGYCAFDDELILIGKAYRETIDSGDDDWEIITKEQVRASYINLKIPYASNSQNLNFDSFVKVITTQEIVPTENSDPVIIDVPFSEVQNSNETIDLSYYFEEIFADDSHYELCEIITDKIPENNTDYIDFFISLKINSETGEIEDKLIWSGNLNIPINSKIVTQGIFENNFYKRVYFTDYVNPFRVMNIKDPNISGRKAKEFSAFQNIPMLRPIVDSIENNGQIKASTCMYVYRLITENGQVSGFSPISEDVKILINDTDLGFAGGDVAETTSKNVTVKCNVLNYDSFKDIECVAIEYEAAGAPTAIRTLGKKSVSAVVYFNHYGNEDQFSENITLSDILERKNSWKYCSDLSSKSNLLIAAGLRNEPIPAYFSNVTHFFALHAWDQNNQTFESYINPDPVKYAYIDPLNQNKMFFSNRKLYNSIQVFQSFTISLVDKLTGNFVSTFIQEKSILKYDEYIDEIYSWLESIANTQDFISKFPSIKVKKIQNKILFSRMLGSSNFDFSNLGFEYSTSQVIEDYQDEIKFDNLNTSGTKIRGYQSLGYNQGNGIRITFKTEEFDLMKQATGPYPSHKPLVDLVKPNQKRYFFKGEIYRLGLQIWLKDGTEPFVIVLGDIKIPDIGENISRIDINGIPISTNDTYKNSFTEGEFLKGMGIYLDVDVRLSCDFQQKISMYQIVYVERNEDNKTILCQGISGPLERVNNFFHTEFVNLKAEVNNKWMLPYFGGPNYDYQGLITGDANINESENVDDRKRVVTARNLFYFDSPDIIFNLMSPDKINNGFIQPISRLNHDQRRDAAYTEHQDEIYPAFSRRIPNASIEGDGNSNPIIAHFSMFIERLTNEKFDSLKIEKSERMLPGEIKSSSSLDMEQQISNNALTLGRPTWFYEDAARKDEKCNNTSNSGTALHYELFKSQNFAIGNDTVFIKTKENLFTNNFINQAPVKLDVHSYIDSKLSYYGIYPVYDTHALVNVKSNNADSIYGGRSEVAYAKNVYMPLSETIPVLNYSNNIQKIKVFGDTYCTLFLRMKSYFNNNEVPQLKMDNHSSCRNKYEEEEYSRRGGFLYGVVLETMIEPRWTYDDLFYKDGKDKINFSSREIGRINNAYLQKNNLKSYIPKPYNFKDDPNLSNIIAISDPKMSGDYVDSWSSFKINNFYEVEKNKGTAYNLAKFLDKIYVIQENQTSVLIINENVAVSTTNGQISMKQGEGNVISGHNVISDFGTSIRRAIVESISNDQKMGGFTFIDEKKFEWVKNTIPKLTEKSLALKFKDIFENDPIIDTEGYYDDEYKETNIRITTKSGNSFMLSFNELFDAFNGWMQIDSTIFLMWKNKVFAPKIISKKMEIHEFNAGNVLNIFGEQKTVKLEVTINVNPQTVKIFKVWAGNININYPIKQIIVKTSLGQERVISGDHHRYQINEGVHNVPLKNRLDFDDLRGEWATLEIEVESKENKMINMFSFINFVRHSNL